MGYSKCVERCVLALTEEKNWVLDPFAGVGSSVIAAIKNDRNAIGIERDESYCKIAKKNLGVTHYYFISSAH